MRWWLTAVVMVLAGALLGTTPAYGHVGLVSSDPADGATLDTSPNQAVLAFSDPVNRDLSQVALTIDETPTPLPAPSRIVGGTITVPLPGGPGRYRIAYRAVGTDGHRIDGRVRFTVTGPPGSRPSQPDTVDSAPATEPDDGSTSPAVAVVVSEDQGGGPFWPVVLGALLLIGALAYVLTIGRNRGEETTSSGGTTIESRNRGDQPEGDHPEDGDRGDDRAAE
ncbi:MAG TPA: copper resistance CopC family protein [Micromonosporaceae bacterium]